MPSTNKTQILSLNKWIATDHPKREDFVNDNVLIDNAIALTFKEINLSNNVITFTRFNNSTYKVNLPKIATNSENGLISYNKVNELFDKKYTPKEREINTEFSTVKGKIEANKGSIANINREINGLRTDLGRKLEENQVITLINRQVVETTLRDIWAGVVDA